MPEYIPYNIAVITVNKGGFYDVQKNCNGLQFTNTGDTIVRVNEMILYPGVIGVSLGDSRTVGGNEGEVYKGNIKVSFAFPGGANPALEIVQKFYPE